MLYFILEGQIPKGAAYLDQTEGYARPMLDDPLISPGEVGKDTLTLYTFWYETSCTYTTSYLMKLKCQDQYKIMNRELSSLLNQ